MSIASSPGTMRAESWLPSTARTGLAILARKPETVASAASKGPNVGPRKSPVMTHRSQGSVPTSSSTRRMARSLMSQCRSLKCRMVKPSKPGGSAREADAVALDADPLGILGAAPVEARGLQGVLDGKGGELRVLDVEEIEPLPEHLGFVIALHAQALPGVQAPQPLLEPMLFVAVQQKTSAGAGNAGAGRGRFKPAPCALLPLAHREKA